MRRSLPVACGEAETVVATTCTVKPYGSLFGLPFDVCPAPSPVSRPRKLLVVASTGKRVFRCGMSTAATVPSIGPVWWVVPSHPPAGIWVPLSCSKSPVGVGSLFGYDPGATSTLHVYACPRAQTCAFTSAVAFVGSTCANQSGEVISTSGGTCPSEASWAARYALTRP